MANRIKFCEPPKILNFISMSLVRGSFFIFSFNRGEKNHDRRPFISIGSVFCSLRKLIIFFVCLKFQEKHELIRLKPSYFELSVRHDNKSFSSIALFSYINFNFFRALLA